MATHRSPANKGQATHKSVPTSKMSKSPHPTKPENRHPTTHTYGVSGANAIVKKVVC